MYVWRACYFWNLSPGLPLPTGIVSLPITELLDAANTKEIHRATKKTRVTESGVVVLDRSEEEGGDR